MDILSPRKPSAAEVTVPEPAPVPVPAPSAPGLEPEVEYDDAEYEPTIVRGRE